MLLTVIVPILREEDGVSDFHGRMIEALHSAGFGLEATRNIEEALREDFVCGT
jgi:hypothetical protein